MDTSFCVDFDDKIIQQCRDFFECKAEVIVIGKYDIFVQFKDGKKYDIPLGIRGCYFFNTNAIVVRLQKTMAEMLTTFCHEIVHYKQWIKKKCFFLNNDVVLFDGKKYTISKTNYYDRPWEKEAYNKEIDYCANFLKSLPLSIKTTIMNSLKNEFGE